MSKNISPVINKSTKCKCNDNQKLKTKKVLVIYTGGTIGMQMINGYYAPKPNVFYNKIKTFFQLYDEDYTNSLANNEEDNLLGIREIIPGYSLLYKLEEYDPLLDSSNMDMNYWKKIALDIEKNYDNFDGFVILHGTDTLAYTSSALSFMLEGLQKTVVVTGSQISIFERRTDAVSNIYDSLVFASSINFEIPEVCVCFNGKLLRGNRAIKYSSTSLNAFRSPNYLHLGNVDNEYTVRSHNILKKKDESLKVHSNLEENITVLQLFPGIPITKVEDALKDVKALVLLSYGAGNIPSSRINLIDTLKNAVARGVLIVNITQCTKGDIGAMYETAKDLAEIGIISGNDMTTEATVAKLAYVLGLPNLSFDERKKVK